MNNIVIEKVWEDENVIELKITAVSEYVTAYQTCYTNTAELARIRNEISGFLNDFTHDYYIQIGKKEGNYTSAFSMNLKKANLTGHVNIEMDIEIADIDDRSHRCKFFVDGELGAIERFGMNLKYIGEGEIGEEISLYEK